MENDLVSMLVNSCLEFVQLTTPLLCSDFQSLTEKTAQEKRETGLIRKKKHIGAMNNGGERT